MRLFVVSEMTSLLYGDKLIQRSPTSAASFSEDFPAATGIVVKELLGRGVLIEMDAVAVL